MTRGPAIRPTRVATIPKCSSVWSSASPMRSTAAGSALPFDCDLRRRLRSGSTYSPCSWTSVDVEERRRILLEVLGRDEQGRRLGADDVGERVHRVDRRLGPGRARFAAAARTRAGCGAPSGRGAAHGGVRAADEGAHGGSGQQQHSDDEREYAEDRRARARGACRGRLRRPCPGSRRGWSRGWSAARTRERRAPTRKGRKSTSSLRATMSAPTTANVTGMM